MKVLLKQGMDVYIILLFLLPLFFYNKLHTQQSAEGAKRSRDEVAKLGDNLTALNNIYGNMLAAMNVNVGSGGNTGGGSME